VPLCCAGFTDSHWLREAFGTVAYGFFPLRTMERELAARLIHSADERTHVDDLGLGVEFLRAAAPLAGVADARAQLAGGASSDRGVSARARLLRPGGEELEADLYLGYGLSEPLRAARDTAPPGAVPAAARGRGRSGQRSGPDRSVQAGPDRDVGADWTDAEYGDAVEAVRAAIGRGDVYQVNLVQHLARHVRRRSRLAVAARRVRAARFAGDGWAIVSASPELFLARRGRRCGPARSRARARSASTSRARRTPPST
jgi:hypothetical protein